ncbi:MAG: hypothetical protein ACO363_06430, partial [Balneolaceae bacterium]
WIYPFNQGSVNLDITKLSLLHGGTYMKQKRSIPYKYFFKSFPHRPCNSEPSSPQRISLHS